MKPVFINGRFLSQPITGAQRYGHELIRQLDSMLAEFGSNGISVTILIPPSVTKPPQYRALSVLRIGRLTGHAWEQLELPVYARRGLLFTPSGGAPVLHRRNVITIHDAAVVSSPQGYSFTFRTWYGLLNWILCHSALHVLTVSYFSKAELIKHYGAKPQNTTVTYLGAEHALRPAADPDFLKRHQLRRFAYVLLVASRNPNKNIAGVMRALPYLAASDLQIAIVGHRDVKVFGDFDIANEQVRDLGYVNDSELRTLYENAACFVFPSFYEGFGLPPLEALALGSPTVVSSRASLVEIFGEIAFMCDPNNPEDIAEKILKTRKITEEQRLRNREFARGFTWDKCAKATWDLLSHLSQL